MLPKNSEGYLLIRTDFQHPDEWQDLIRVIQTPSEDGFLSDLYPVSDRDHDGAMPEQLSALISSEFTLVAIADSTTLLGDGYPVLIVSVSEPDLEPFRCAAANLWSPVCNLQDRGLGARCSTEVGGTTSTQDAVTSNRMSDVLPVCREVLSVWLGTFMSGDSRSRLGVCLFSTRYREKSGDYSGIRAVSSPSRSFSTPASRGACVSV
ncbi:DUF6924 domain-containing protein [Tessaracoccus caeni]|uniref:DUF6924 domain-containing protein n=1 Tax=Tessaracoccus caeni TaxID=3031239 RepID=UPI0023DA3919|nr:hypothetical protein [Tessaracoccus caeni]MDF1489888.1 hypothetical protein [Tessaracoccus caeni]